MFIHALEEHMPSLPLYTIAFTPYFHFHASFPTIFSSIFLSLVWGIWTPSKHGPWLYIFWHHVIWPLVSFHHSFHPPPHIVFPPFTMPWLSLVIGPNPFYPFYLTFIQSNSSNHFNQIHFQSIFPYSNPFTSNQFCS